jgi:hypothetical protein
MLIITVVYKVIESLHLANDNVHLPTVSSIAEQQSEGDKTRGAHRLLVKI